MPFKFSISIGLILFIISACYLLIRDEPFSIWESAIRYWPMTLFGIAYAIVYTVTFQGFMYNEASIVAPIENIANGSFVILLVLVYVLTGRADSVWDVLTVPKIVGIICIMTGLIALGIVQDAEAKEKGLIQKKSFKTGAKALIFPIIFSFMDGMETLVSGICLDKTYGLAMPEGDSVIIGGMEYAVFAFVFWIYVSYKEKHLFNPFTKANLPHYR